MLLKVWLTALCVLVTVAAIAGTISSTQHNWRGWETITKFTMIAVIINMTVAGAIIVWNF